MSTTSERVERPLSGVVTVLSVLVVVAAASWQASRETARDWSLDYAGATIRYVERTVEVADAAERAEPRILRLVSEGRDEVRRRGIERLQRAIDRLELEERFQDVRTLRAHLVWLLRDSGRRTEADRELAILSRFPGAPCDFCEAVAFADASSPNAAPPRSLAPLREGWAATALRIRLLEATGRADEAAQLRAESVRSARARIVRMAFVLGAAACLLYVGVLSLVFEARYTAWRPRIAGPAPVAGWRWTDGIGVVARSELVGLGLSSLTIWYGCGGALSFVCLWASFFWFLPVVWLVRRHVVAGPWTEALRDFRLLPSDWSAREVFRISVGLLTILWLGGAALEAMFRWIGGETDLSEMYFDPMMMDTPPRVAAAVVNAVVWGPLTEELTFRGLLYMSLRAIVRAPVAAFASAALFAAAHLYSMQTSVVIFAMGLVLAFGLERYRTLLPGLLCHALANLFMVISNLVAYR